MSNTVAGPFTKTIAITQRQIFVGEHREQRDSLSDDWYRLAEALGIGLLVLPNRPGMALEMLRTFSPDGLILSNGENLPLDNEGRMDNVRYNERENTEAKLLSYAIQTDMPVLGVCRGCQFIALRYGAYLTDIADGSHIAQNHHVSMAFPHWAGTSRMVNSYHQFRIMPSAAAGYEVLATDNKQGIEAFRLSGKAVWGIMWHPEREYFTATDSDGFNQYLFHQVFGS